MESACACGKESWGCGQGETNGTGALKANDNAISSRFSGFATVVVISDGIGPATLVAVEMRDGWSG